MVVITVAVDEHDGDRADAVVVGLLQVRARALEVERRQHLAPGRGALLDLDHPLVEEIGQHDAAREEVRPVLIADA